MSAVRHIFLYRNEGGKRQKYRFTVDNTMTIISEEPCHETGVPLAVTEQLRSENRQTEAAMAASPQLQELKKRGIDFHLEDGKIMLDKIPELELQIAQFFVPEAECPWPGCESLRKQYMKELHKLEESNCSDCDKGSLQGKYRKVVMKHLGQHAANDTQKKISTRNQGVS